jgi:hypothetical protein
LLDTPSSARHNRRTMRSVTISNADCHRTTLRNWQGQLRDQL